MAIDSHTEPAHELRLEGFKLLASMVGLGSLVLAAIIGSFLLGRWVESRSRPTGPIDAAGGGPLGRMVAAEPDADATDNLTYFDRLEGTEQQAEPSREIPLETTSTDTALAAPGEDEIAAPVTTTASRGDFFVQVFAGRDRSSAEALVSRLQGAGYGVSMLAERDGRHGLYKVRVGGYGTDDAAREAAAELRSRGYPGAWVTRAE